MAVSDYLTNIENYISGAKQDVEETTQAVADVSGAQPGLPFKLREALQKKLDYNRDIIEQQADVEADYIAAPARAREKYQDVWNPFARERMVAEERAQAYKPYAVLSDVLGQRMGTVSDIVGQGVAGWQGIVNQANVLNQSAQQKLAQAMDEYQMAAQMQQAADQLEMQEKNYQLALDKFGFQQEQFEWEKPWQEKMWQYQLDKPYPGGGTSMGMNDADLKAYNVWNDLMAQTGGDEWQVWSALNRDQGALRAAGVNVDALWRWHADLARSQQPAETIAADEGDGGWAGLRNWFGFGGKPHGMTGWWPDISNAGPEYPEAPTPTPVPGPGR
jgi:hypothetical protein